MTKYCVNCRYHLLYTIGYDTKSIIQHRCRNEKAKSVDLITGKAIEAGDCCRLRAGNLEDVCGEEGRWYEKI